jgi:hypothetical protein
MRTLLTIAQLKKYRSISDYCKVEALNPFVNEAAMIELQNILGEDLYDKVIEDISPLNYPALEPFIEPILAYYAYARWLPKQAINVTAFGVVQKRTDFSEPVDAKTLFALAGNARENAKPFESKLVKYLNDNSTLYPEWKQTCVKRSPNAGAIRIGAVGNDIDINDYVKEEVNKYGYIRK